MNLRLATWLLTSTALMSSTVSAAGIRGKDKQQRRVLQGKQPAKYLVQDIQYEHDESDRRLNMFSNRPEKIDTVELEGNLIYTVEGFVPPGWTVSGQDVFLPPNTIIDDETATITLPNNGSGRLLEGEGDGAPKVESALKEDQERNLSELNRQLAVVTGEKSVLAVKIVLSDDEYRSTDSYLECKVFGTSNGADCGDTYHLTNAYSDCSYGKLQFKKAAPRTDSSLSTVTSISNGVVTVTLSGYSTSQGDGTVRNAVTSALNTAFGSATSLADHLMYCMPPGTMSGIAYAYINHWNSVYSNNWCNNVSAQLHEIGHNLNLAHSNEGSTTYADQSGMMGYSYNNESTPRMCFNAAKNYQLGWYSDKMKVITPGAATDSCFAGNLYGTALYENAAAQTVGIKVNNSGSSTDVYIMYNAKTGIQSGTVEGGNQVMVVTAGAEGTGYSESTLVQKITTSSTGYSLPGFSNTVLYVDSNTANSHASIRIETNGQACVVVPTPNPTPVPPTNPPTPPPTGSPTLPQPTSSPTTAPPTNPPTPAPTVSCGDIQVKSECNNAANCVWNGNPNNGSCDSSIPSPPSPPSPTPPPTSGPPTTCPVCAADGQECCAPKTCFTSGKPSNRGCK